jgi:hypothetical protein
MPFKSKALHNRAKASAANKAKAPKPTMAKGTKKAAKEAADREFRDRRIANYIPHIKDIF